MSEPKGRFVERQGGWICDRVTGLDVARVNIRVIDTNTAHRAALALIDGLHREFGPRGSGVPSQLNLEG